MRIILDTNVLVRAAKRRTNPARRLLHVTIRQNHTLVTSPFQLRELARVMNYPRVRAQHRLRQNGIQRYVQAYHAAAEVPELAADDSGEPISTDPDDDPILRLAAGHGVEVICTLDRHFHTESVRAFCRRRGIAIMTDVELLTRLRPRKTRKGQAAHL